MQALAPNVAVLGEAEAAAPVEFQVALRLRHAQELNARIAAAEIIGADELERRYLPTQAAYDAVRAWLESQGLAATRTHANRVTIEAAGTAASVGRALAVRFARIRAEGREFTAAASAPAVPGVLAEVVESVNGLQPHLHYDKLGVARAMPSTVPARAAEGGFSTESTISGNYLPGGILRAYKALPALSENGAGTRTAIVIDAFPNPSDLTDFWSLGGIPQSLSNIEFVQVGRGTPPAPSGEETLDTEWASGVGYGSKVRVYATVTLAFTAIDSAFQAILGDIGKGTAIQQVSVSLGACETGVSAGERNTENNLLSLLAAQGVSIFVSSGDSGARECGPTGGKHAAFPSTSPYVTAVGGTHLITTTTSNPNALNIKSETAWSGSGGGVSATFAPPSYQSGLGYAKRAVPDVAADADPATGVAIILNGSQEEIGGTSASAPIWAGLMSLVNQARFAAGKTALGPLNPRLYPLAGTSTFRDVTAGCNGGYCSAVGYDLTTGLGSPVMSTLLPALVAQP